MGLKYQVFMIKGTADELHRTMFTSIADVFIDTSDLSRREREYYDRPVPPIETSNGVKESEDPVDPGLESWMKDGGQTGFHIWWMDHPTRKGFVVGGYTSHWVHEHEYTSLFCGVLIKCGGYEEILLQSFHHGVNDGHIRKIKLIAPVDAIDYESFDDEEQKWGKYSKRVQSLCGYPVMAWHYYLTHLREFMVPWKYSVMTKDPSG